MVIDNTKLLLRLVVRPSAAMSQILDYGSLLFASLAVLIATFLMQSAVISRLPRVVMVTPPPAAVADPTGEDAPIRVPVQPWWSFSFYTPLLVMAVVYVPGTIVVSNAISRLGGFGSVFHRDYPALLTCTAMAWAVANLMLALVGSVVPLSLLGPVVVAACFYFAVLMFFAVRTVFGTDDGIAIAAVCLSWIPLAGAIVFWGPLRFLLSLLASPFFLFFVFYFLRGEFAGMGAGLRRSQSFRRMLEASAVNPHDAEAQYQLGLIYQQRRQYTEAIQRFTNAVRIDRAETDSHFQLGRIAREQDRLKDALAEFQIVLDLNEKHSQNEILREIGGTYLAAGQYEDARRELETYLERRPYDSEGLYYYGQALQRLGRNTEAAAVYARAVEAARTGPQYLRRFTAKWSRLAQKQARKLDVVAS